MKFADFIRKRRSQLGITQFELATRMSHLDYDMQDSGISHWERGRRTPPIGEKKFRVALAAALEMTEVDLMRELEFAVEQGSHSYAGERAASLVDQMTPDQQERALKILEALL